MEKETLRKLISRAMSKFNDSWDNVQQSTIHKYALDDPRYVGYNWGFGSELKGSKDGWYEWFLWTKEYVYFPVYQEYWTDIGTVPLKPIKKAFQAHDCYNNQEF